MKKEKRMWELLIFVFAGAVFMLISILLYYNLVVKYKNDGLKTTITVVELKDSNSDKNLYFQYYVDGQRYLIKLSENTIYYKGEKLEVYYLESNPNDLLLDENSKTVSCAFFFGISFFITMAGLVLFLNAETSRKKKSSSGNKRIKEESLDNNISDDYSPEGITVETSILDNDSSDYAIKGTNPYRTRNSKNSEDTWNAKKDKDTWDTEKDKDTWDAEKDKEAWDE